jgi:predicted acyl esterase
VRLTDVYPDGRSMLVVDGIRRLRFADGYTPVDTGQVAPGSITELSIPMTAHLDHLQSRGTGSGWMSAAATIRASM